MSKSITAWRVVCTFYANGETTSETVARFTSRFDAEKCLEREYSDKLNDPDYCNVRKLEYTNGFSCSYKKYKYDNTCEYTLEEEDLVIFESFDDYINSNRDII